MVHFVRLLSAAALATLSSAAPAVVPRDSAIGGEVAVSAPNGVVLSDTPTASSGAVQTASSSDQSNSGYSGSGYSGSNSGYSGSNSGYSGDNSGDNSGYSGSSSDSYNTDSNTDQYTSSSDSYNQYTTSSDSYNQYTTSSDSYNQYTTSSDSYNQYTTSSDSYNQYTTSSDSYNQYTTSSDSYNTDYNNQYTTSSTIVYDSTSTSSAYVSSYTPSYGSGSSNWGGSGYNDCVMQCAASFGGMDSMASATWVPPTATQDSYAGQSGSNGVTHTIIVAPSQGVLRYVPFATNASAGDTVEFHWNAGPHTVTQSSALEVCNKTDLSTAFASGMQQAGFTYDMVINDTTPIWFYCGVTGHCEKGMFGGINIGEAAPGGSSYMSLGSMVVNMTSSSSDCMAMWQYTKNVTSGNSYASNWGMGINVAGMDSNSMMEVMNNVMWTQQLIAANPDNVDAEKGFQVSNKPLNLPVDLSSALASAPAPSSPAAATGGAAASSAAVSSGAAGAAASPTATGKSNGAASVASSSVAIALVAIVASFLML